MKASRFSDSQKAFILKQGADGILVEFEACTALTAAAGEHTEIDRNVGKCLDSLAITSDVESLFDQSPDAGEISRPEVVAPAAQVGAGVKDEHPSRLSACDEVLAWSPDGSLLAFDRSRPAADTTFTIGRAGSPLRQAGTGPPPADSLRWPAQCATFFRLGDDWLVADSAGRQHLVGHPSAGAANWTVLRCS